MGFNLSNGPGGKDGSEYIDLSTLMSNTVEFKEGCEKFLLQRIDTEFITHKQLSS